ncbi:MAG: hypothetical protein ABIS06_20905 [Vicinamibacterales bacterium]
MLSALRTGELSAACFEPADRALLAYAEKLTLTPAAISHDDLFRLRAAGFDDHAIHDACAIVAYFAFVNRIANGLGVELEDSLPCL